MNWRVKIFFWCFHHSDFQSIELQISSPTRQTFELWLDSILENGFIVPCTLFDDFDESKVPGKLIYSILFSQAS